MSTQAMNHWERVRATLKGEEVDRPAASFWCHYFEQENTAEKLAVSMLNHQKKYDWDFMKIQARSTYIMEAFGLEVFYEPSGRHGVTKRPCQTEKDLAKLTAPDVTKGPLGEMLESAKMIADSVKGEVPFIWSIYSPAVVASRLMPSEAAFLQCLYEHPDEAQHAMTVVGDTLIDFSREMVKAGATGFFYGTNSWATKDILTVDNYKKHIAAHDLRVLNALPELGSEFTLLHVCRNNCMVSELANYPVQILNWDSRGKGNPALSAVREIAGGRAVMGGVNYDQRLVNATPEQVKAEVSALITAMGKKNWVLGGGCSYQRATPEENMLAVRQALDE